MMTKIPIKRQSLIGLTEIQELVLLEIFLSIFKMITLEKYLLTVVR